MVGRVYIYPNHSLGKGCKANDGTIYTNQTLRFHMEKVRNALDVRSALLAKSQLHSLNPRCVRDKLAIFHNKRSRGHHGEALCAGLP